MKFLVILENNIPLRGVSFILFIIPKAIMGHIILMIRNQ
jgi:hypothetical protein